MQSHAPLSVANRTNMKALHFGRFYNDSFGGLERHVALLLRGLSRDIHVDNLVANERFEAEELTVDGYRVYKIPSLGLLAGTSLCPTMPLWTRRLHQKNHYNIVHLHFPDPMAHLAASVLPKEVKVIISWHSDIVRQKNALKLYRPFLDRIVGRAVAVIAATPAHFSSSSQLGVCSDPGKRHVVPYGIDFSPFDASSAMAAGIALRGRYHDRPIIFAVGRHVYYKGFEFLIRAMKSVDKNAILLLGGSGPLSNDLKALAKEAEVADRVHFLGRIADEELPAYFHAADVFCMPSVEPSEAFGMVQVEAMSCRKPVICCELNNGVTYVNQHGKSGLVVPRRDVPALADAINTLLHDDALRINMGVAGRARAESEFTLQRMWSGMMDVYKSL